MKNFTQCAADYAASNSSQNEYSWGNRTIIGINYRNSSSLISREGCLRLCGTGTDYYPWEDVSSTITTWILPVVGTLLQAPFESNATSRTLLAITRWVGSPIASLSYVLWNIKVSAKAALMVDMAVKYDETPDYETLDGRTDFGSMRDSMYLLLVMNQYTLKTKAYPKEAEGLLRIVLFSKDLKLTGSEKMLRQRRRKLATEVREMRRRGAVPAFVSIMWFLFAFALSIQDAFGDLGANATAHDLALGCLLAWFPILIMGSIVDRNPIAAESIRKKLNRLVDDVRKALGDEQHRNDFISKFHDHSGKLEAWVNNVERRSEYMDDFFADFAGQGRIRWHYGAAHPILSDIENCYIADKGRNWLENDQEARSSLVLGPVNADGLVWFDVREFWQVASAIVIVAGSCGGAFILSYFTPTVGLGCRSGGYTIFFSVALGLLIMEMTVWLLLSPYELIRATDSTHDRWKYLRRRASNLLDVSTNLLVRCTVRVVLIFPLQDKDTVKDRIEKKAADMIRNIESLGPHRKWDVFFFRPIETFNTIWLVYIVLAQVFGWYKTCACVTSTWAGGGGYLDFNVQDKSSDSTWVRKYWTGGTLLTSIVLGLSMFYITVEWCQQSFLSTENYDDAMAGLRKTRTYRYWTYIFRQVSRVLSRLTLDPMERIAVKIQLIKKRQKTLLWTKEHRQVSGPSPRSSWPGQGYNTNASPLIQITDYSTNATNPDLHGAPTSMDRSRTGSNASLSSAPSHGSSRSSNDSSLPLMQLPARGVSTQLRRWS